MLLHIHGSSTYLADSMHLLPPNAPTIPAALWRIQQGAACVFFESDLDKPPGIPPSAFLPPETPLSSLVSAQTFGATAALWQRFGIQVPLETLKPWFAGLLLANSLSGTIGFNHQAGVDRQIWQVTAPEKRRLLEGTEALGAFDAAPPGEQSAYLDTIARTPEIITARFTRLYQHWQTSNVVGFEQELVWAKEQFPIMFTGLIDGRNRSWLPTIVDRAKQVAPALVLVGALHLVGESGIPALLTDRGFLVGAA